MIALIGSFKLDIFMMRLTILGYGNQARSWALNLKDSGFPVRVALRPQSQSMELARTDGMEVVEFGSKDFFQAKVFALLTPDLSHHEILAQMANNLPDGAIILYAHGYSLLKHQFQIKYPHLQHILFAPKSIGSELRVQYQQKGKLGAVYSLEFLHANHEEIEKWISHLAIALGINMGPFKTNFKNETEADLYSEQGLLCGLIPYVAEEMFSHLIQKGIEPELAYFECWHELKLIINAMVDKGPEDFFDLISPNALIGSEKGYQRIFNDNFKSSLKSLLSEIQNGTFDQELDSTDAGAIRRKIKKRWQTSPLQKTFLDINQDKK
jgi:ketol-acid reductoisomerase